jgi:hypothetical protein
MTVIRIAFTHSVPTGSRALAADFNAGDPETEIATPTMRPSASPTDARVAGDRGRNDLSRIN